MKYKGLNKFFFKKSQNIKCGHLKYAIENKLLDISEEANDSEHFDPSFLDQYLSIADVFKNDTEEISDAIKYFLSLKEKVKIFFEQTYAAKIKNSFKNFEISYEGLFTIIDYINIDKSTKTITWYLISPSTWDRKSYFIDLQKTKPSSEMPTFHNNPKRVFAKEIQLLYDMNWNNQEFFQILQKANAQFLNQSLTNFIVDGQTLFNDFITIGSFKANKRDKIYGILFNLFILHKKYPSYKINTIIPLLNKDYNYSFSFLQNTLDPNSELGKLQMALIEEMIEQSYWQLNLPAEKFNLPKWISSYPTTRTTCIICKMPLLQIKNGRDFNQKAIKPIVKKFNGKVAMLDFETINDPLPKPNYYKPYSKIVVQVSLHYVNNGALESHREYLVKDLSLKELEKIYDIVVDAVKQDYKLVAYYAPFERSALKEMERVLKRNDISQVYELRSMQETKLLPRNTPILDLREFFLKPTKERIRFRISLYRFGNSTSIKKTIELYAGDNNPYKNLNINNGFKAMAELYDIIVNNNQEKINEKRQELLAYCKQDTLTMVHLYQKILELNRMDESSRKKALEKLDI